MSEKFNEYDVEVDNTGANEDLSGKASEKMIEKWKKKHGAVYEIEVEGNYAYIKQPDRKILGMAGKVSGEDVIKFNETILRQCWLGGNMDIINKDRLFFGASDKIDQIIERAEATVKKL